MVFGNFDLFNVLGWLSLLGDTDFEVRIVSDGFHYCFSPVARFEMPGNSKPVAFQ
jgi:hypothetical protein